ARRSDGVQRSNRPPPADDLRGRPRTGGRAPSGNGNARRRRLGERAQVLLPLGEPLRGLLAVPIVGEDGLNYGLLQASDKVDGTDFDTEDERRPQCLADAAAVGLDALRKVRALRLGKPAPAASLDVEARFVVIETS